MKMASQLSQPTNLNRSLQLVILKNQYATLKIFLLDLMSTL
jgi:hypothetical protein